MNIGITGLVSQNHKPYFNQPVTCHAGFFKTIIIVIPVIIISHIIYIYTYYIILYHIPKKVVYHHWVYSCTKKPIFKGRYSNPPNVALSNHSSHVVILAPIVVLLPHTSCSILQGPKPPRPLNDFGALGPCRWHICGVHIGEMWVFDLTGGASHLGLSHWSISWLQSWLLAMT